MSYVTCRLSNECRCQSQWHRLRLPVGLAAERPPTGYVESTANSNNRVVYEVVTLHSGCTVDASLHQTMTTFYRLCWRAIIVTNSISGSRVRSDRRKQRASSSDIHKHMLRVTSLAYLILLINKSASSQNSVYRPHATVTTTINNLFHLLLPWSSLTGSFDAKEAIRNFSVKCMTLWQKVLTVKIVL